MDARREAREKASGEEQAPIVYERGEGSNVVDVDGNRYVDLAAGFGALLLGHVPAGVAEALGAQERLTVARARGRLRRGGEGRVCASGWSRSTRSRGRA